MATSAQAVTFFYLTSSGVVGTIDAGTGTFVAAPTNDAGLVGLGQLGSTVYGESANSLFTINTTSGAETLIGAASGLTTSFIDFGSTTTGLFAVGGDGNLYTINASTGAAVLDGSLGLGTLTRTSAGDVVLGMSTASSTLYFADGATFYSLNTSTGFATSIAAFSSVVQAPHGDMLDFGAFTTTGGTLYAGYNQETHSSHTGLASINPANAQATFIAEVTPNPNHSFQFLGLVPGKAVPEPSAWALMLLGVGAVGGALRSRRRRVTASV